MKSRFATILCILLCWIAIAGLAALVFYSRSRQKKLASSGYDDESAEQLRVIEQVLNGEYVPEDDALTGIVEDSAPDAYAPHMQVPAEDLTEQETDHEAVPETETETEIETETETESPYDHRFILVGDSRTVSMHNAMMDYEDPCIYIAQSGEGYEWFQNEGLSELKDVMNVYKKEPVAFMLGVNDTENIDNYLRVYRELKEEYPQRSFYYVSVNPVTDECEALTEEDIAQFNSILEEVFPDGYLDSFSYLKKEGFETVDGLHYKWETSCRIHDFLWQKISPKTYVKRTFEDSTEEENEPEEDH